MDPKLSCVNLLNGDKLKGCGEVVHVNKLRIESFKRFASNETESALAAANRIRLLEVYAFLKRKHIGSQVVIATYHRVSMRKDKWPMENLSPESFESQIRYFCRNFEILSLEQLVRDLQQGRSLPKKAAVITFDDGYRDNYVYAFPILRKYAVPPTFFLTTSYIGGSKLFWWDKVGYLVHHTTAARLEVEELGRYALESEFDRRRATLMVVEKLYLFPEERKNGLLEKLADVCGVDIPGDLGSQLILSWEEVEEMSLDGVQFGAHSVTHPNLTNLPPEQAKWEICQSKEDIEKRLRKKVDFFSYPGGGLNAEIVEMVKQNGFVAAVTTDPSWVTPSSDLYRLGRIGMMYVDHNRSAALLCGTYGDLLTALRRGKK